MDWDIRTYLKLLKRWWWLLILGALIPMGVSYVFASRQPDYYQARATVMVGSSLQDPNPDPWQMNMTGNLASAYAELVKQRPVTEAVIQRLGLAEERSPEALAGQIQTRIYSEAQLLEIQVTDANPEAAALIANALAEELIRRSPASSGVDPEQQEFVRAQLEELQAKIERVGADIDELTGSLADLTSAAEIQEAQERIAALEQVKSTYQSTYASLLEVSLSESPNMLSLFSPALKPEWPIPQRTNLTVAVAGAAGLGLALAAVVGIEYFDPSLRWDHRESQSVLGLSNLGAIPRVRRDGRYVMDKDTPAPLSAGFHALLANLTLIKPENPYGTLLVTSPGVAEGKSFTAANLAAVMASAGKRVIVVDGDLRRPTLHEFFGQPNVVGLAEFLDSSRCADAETPEALPLRDTGIDRLRFLAAGRLYEDPAVLLTSSRMSELLEVLKGQADVVVIDSPPVLGPPDALIMATLVDGALLVASHGMSERDLVRKARNRLQEREDVNLLGIVLNRVKPGRDGYYGTYGYSARREAGEPREEAEGRTWMSLDEAARYLGISKSMARRWCRTGRMTAERSRLRWRVRQEDVIGLVEEWSIESR
jgi:capsular exopolysaccharide synthesis family protein